MTSEDKFKVLLKYFGYPNKEPISWLSCYFHNTKEIEIKYPELYKIIEKLRIRDSWVTQTLCGSKILAVELIYSQLVKDGKIIDDSQAV